MEYNLVVCGGTFEHLHIGHKAFLRFVFSKGKKVLIGLTSDLYVQSIHKNTKLSLSKRKKMLEEFLTKENVLERANILPIDDIYIPKQWENLPIEAIVATKDSLFGASAINKQRKQQGLKELEIVLCPLVTNNNGKTISSSNIRTSLNISQLLFLPDDVRAELKKPLGILIKDFDKWVAENKKNLNSEKIVTVGDVVTKTCNELFLQQAISIVDFHVGREKKFSNIIDLGFSGEEQVIDVQNKAGFLTPVLFQKIESLFKIRSTARRVILVEGEEDLAVLPCIIFSPLGFHIFYGQPNEGVVAIEVSKSSKESAAYIISRFIPHTRGH